MTWCNDCNDVQTIETSSPPPACNAGVLAQRHKECLTRSCPSCGHQIKSQDQAGIHDLPGLPAGVKFDPTDQELLEHLEGKVKADSRKVHPLIDEFIPTIDGENGICYTHPEKLPGVSKDGLIRHFFHRPSKAYTTGTRKRRKSKGYKKILVLYTNYGKQRKPEKTNWVMHQYHLGNNEEEKDGELVVSKVFYQTQPRQCGSLVKDSVSVPSKFKVQSSGHDQGSNLKNSTTLVDYYHPSSFISFDQSGQNRSANPNPPQQLPPSFRSS
ncbi:putative proteinC DOMAIN-CONTAINING PROTEIN 73 [Salix purpurea]|uniref:NAC domain-containing protein n=1 Tax=Salix purpurea TaxID=77065 RepID=A0A9Q0UQE6_SALPP|nr:putative proteinC DOMAIN-CONTAINING PROTEIN 73 [Salix purpurea]